jgi:DNA polymerase V
MIGHVDADCFYVSAERVRYPHLNGMPIGVLGNHGACIIAKSYELKAAGVYTGMAIWDALSLCPTAVYVKRDFRWYEILSRQMLDIVREHSPQVEFYSIDEQFFVALNDARTLAKRLQDQILAHVHVPVSIGIAPTKTLAKLISDSKKPFGCGVITTDSERRALLRQCTVEDIPGIGQRSAQALDSHGIRTCEQFANADRAFIRWLLTKRGEDLWWELCGESVIPVEITRPKHKFISRGGSIGKASRDPRRIHAFLVRNVERLVEALTYYRICCDHLMLTLTFTDHPERTMRSSLLGSCADFESLLQAAIYLLPRTWQPTSATVHYMDVIAGGLRSIANRQQSLFGQTEYMDVKQKINQAVGRFAIRSGATLPLVDVYGDAANEYDICDIYGKRCF